MMRNYNVRQPNVTFVSAGAQGQPYQPQQQNQYASPNIQVEPKQEVMQQDTSSETSEKPHWMKNKTGPGGVKKVSKKERRRRQNQNLRRLVTPKSALMVLNEMLPGDQPVFKVDDAANAMHFYKNKPSFHAELIVRGKSYVGYGENKTAARNAAAEQAVRDIIIQKLSAAKNSPEDKEVKDESGDQVMSEGGEEEPVPMIQLASYALHKLFSEWEGAGHHVPQLRPPSLTSDTEPEAPKPKKVKVLPENASSLHPCMLLTYMRPQQEYRELGVQGDRPQNLLYTMGVEVDGSTFVGQGPNKKEARKQAAIAACKALFNVTFDK